MEPRPSDTPAAGAPPPASDRERLEHEIRTLRAELARFHAFESFVGTSAAMQPVLALIALAARSAAPALLCGEPGTGKRTAARTIHLHSERRDAPLAVISAGGGAAPAALERDLEAFETAAGRPDGRPSTLLVDGIDRLPLAIQERLLARSGDGARSGVRLVATSRLPLADAVREGACHAELARRVADSTCVVPPLRERASDIPALVDHFLARGRRTDGATPRAIEPEVWDRLLEHTWPGNVAELAAVVEQAVMRCDGGRITRNDLPAGLRSAGAATSGIAPTAGATDPVTGRTTAPVHDSTLAMPPAEPLERTLDRCEAAAIRAALARCQGNRSRAATELGVARVTLYAKMKKHGIG
jgi:DNA-binding NtrC family response regulator